jgi:hypothetical protein
MDPKNMEVIREWRTTTNIPKVGRFLGFFYSYRRFVENLCSISKAIVRIMKRLYVGTH